MALLEGAGTVASSASDALVTGLTQVGTDMSGMITKVLPIGLGIVGAIMVITFGIKILKRVTGKA